MLQSVSDVHCHQKALLTKCLMFIEERVLFLDGRTLIGYNNYC